jgi:hypothetical protein
MRRALFRDIKGELSRLAGVTGFGVGDPRFLERFNKATEELMNDGDFPCVVDRYRFTVYDGAVTLPGDLERIMAVAISGSPIEMRSPWFEFDQFGPGPQEGWTGVDLGLDRGEVATFRDMPAGIGQIIRVYADEDERIDAVRPKLTIMGYNEFGEWVRTSTVDGWIDGEEVELDGDSIQGYVSTSNKWTQIESVIKPETNGTIRLWATDADLVETNIANYTPRETRPSYRRYLFPAVTPSDQAQSVLTRCRRRFVPIRGDNDWVTITNLAAMELMLRAIQKREAEDLDGYISYKNAAAALLTREAQAYHGKARTPAVAFSQGFGLGNFPSVR